MKANDWQDTIAMAASAIEDLLETADEQAGCWADVPARLRALTAPPAPAVVNGRTAEGWMAEALLQKKTADDFRAAMLA